jgi:release factor glutamine methyltransferase
MKLQTALFRSIERLQYHSETASLDAQVLLAHILKKPRTWIAAHPEGFLEAPQVQKLKDALARLESGEPLPYLLGHWEFYGLDFQLTPSVLIPRPETELLVENAIAWLHSHPTAHLAADIGTGSGCIAVSIASHAPGPHFLASDLSWDALQVARQNIASHGLSDHIWPVQADLLPATHLPFDLICANLPYIPTAKLHGLAIYGKEPTLALDGGPDGLVLIRRLLLQASARMSTGGLILLEIEAGRGEAAQTVALQVFPQATIQFMPDMTGQDRLVRIQL